MVEGFRRVAGDEVAQIARRSYAGEEVPDQEWARVFAAFGPQLPDEEREAGTPKNLELNAYGMGLIRQLDIVAQLSRIRSPALVCVGDLDPVTPVAAAEEIAGALPEGTAQLKIIKGAGHFTWKDTPDRIHHQHHRTRTRRGVARRAGPIELSASPSGTDRREGALIRRVPNSNRSPSRAAGGYVRFDGMPGATIIKMQCSGGFSIRRSRGRTDWIFLR
jgi:hypothetical protein